MGVTSPYTNIPNEEGISIVFRTLENENKPPIPTRFLREMLRLFILKKKKKSFHFNEKISRHTEPQWEQKWHYLLLTLSWSIDEVETASSQTPYRALVWKRHIDDIFSKKQ